MFFLNPAKAQITIEPGFQLGVNQYLYTIQNDTGGYLHIDGFGSTMPRFEIPIIITHGKWGIQTGVVFGYPELGYNYSIRNQDVSFHSPISEGSFGSSGPVYKIPLMLRRHVTLKNNSRLSLIPHAGFSWIPNMTTGLTSKGYSSVRGHPGGPNAFEASSEVHTMNKLKLLAEAGIGMELPVLRYFVLQFGATWSFGLQTHEIKKYTYKHINDREHTGEIKSKGNSRNFYIGIRIPFSAF